MANKFILSKTLLKNARIFYLKNDFNILNISPKLAHFFFLYKLDLIINKRRKAYLIGKGVFSNSKLISKL